MNVAATTYKPLWFEVEEAGPGDTTVKKHSGMDYLLLESIAKTLNFTFNVVPVTYWSEVSDPITDAYVLVFLPTVSLDIHTILSSTCP